MLQINSKSAIEDCEAILAQVKSVVKESIEFQKNEYRRGRSDEAYHYSDKIYVDDDMMIGVYVDMYKKEIEVLVYDLNSSSGTIYENVKTINVRKTSDDKCPRIDNVVNVVMQEIIKIGNNVIRKEDAPVIKSIDIDDIDDKTIKEAIIEGVEDYYSQIECGDYMIEFRDDGVKIIGDGTIQATCSFDMSEMSDERGVKAIKEWIKENLVNLLEDVKEYDLKTKDYIKTCIEKGLKLGTFCVEDDYHPVVFSPCGVKVIEYRNNNRLSDDIRVVDEIALDMSEMTDEKGIDIIADWIFNVFKKLMIKAKKDYYKSLKMLENPFECVID